MWCEHGHKMTSYEPLACRCGGHEVWTCRMRLGSRPCGEVRIVPAPSDACGDDD